MLRFFLNKSYVIILFIGVSACQKSETYMYPLHFNSQTWNQGFLYFQHLNDTLHLDNFNFAISDFSDNTDRNREGEYLMREFFADSKNFRIRLELRSKPHQIKNIEDSLTISLKYLDSEQVSHFTLKGGMIDTLKHSSQTVTLNGFDFNDIFVSGKGEAYTLFVQNTNGVLGFVTPQNDTIFGFNN